MTSQELPIVPINTSTTFPTHDITMALQSLPQKQQSFQRMTSQYRDTNIATKITKFPTNDVTI